MAPLIPIAASILPSIIGALTGKKGEARAEIVVGAVQDILKTTDPDQAAEIAASDPERRTALAVRLAEIEAEAAREERAAEIERMAAMLADRQDARATMTTLTKQGSALAWGPVVVSTIVVVGFFATLISLVLLIQNGTAGNGEQGQLVLQIVNIAVGALTAGFATTISFWLGSSNGSQQKDKMMRGGK